MLAAAIATAKGYQEPDMNSRSFIATTAALLLACVMASNPASHEIVANGSYLITNGQLPPLSSVP